jgi:ATP-dependent Clp protease ATP-binding subunit ClpA
VTDRRRPDKAIDALDEACAHTQAVAKYPERAEALIRERVRVLRNAPTRGSADGRAGGREELRDEAWTQMKTDGMSALERFGAEIEAMFSGVPVDAPPPVPHSPAPRPEPAVPPAPDRTLGEIDTELSRVLVEEGIVVRAHDVARVVTLMIGRPVEWAGAAPQA